MTPFGNYPGQLTLLFLRKNHFFGHTALISRSASYLVASTKEWALMVVPRQVRV